MTFFDESFVDAIISSIPDTNETGGMCYLDDKGVHVQFDNRWYIIDPLENGFGIRENGILGVTTLSREVTPEDVVNQLKLYLALDVAKSISHYVGLLELLTS